jgi:hypothetical protein
MGQAQTLDNYSFSTMGHRRDGTATIDPKAARCGPIHRRRPMTVSTRNGAVNRARDGNWVSASCVQHKVWDLETRYIMRPDYFRYNDEGAEIAFLEDF